MNWAINDKCIHRNNSVDDKPQITYQTNASIRNVATVGKVETHSTLSITQTMNVAQTTEDTKPNVTLCLRSDADRSPIVSLTGY